MRFVIGNGLTAFILALTLGDFNSLALPLQNVLPLQLSQSAEHSQHKTSLWGGGVDVFFQADKLHALFRQLRNDRKQIPCVSRNSGNTLNNNGTQAEELLAEADYDGAISVFSELGDYKDSTERVTEAEAAKQEAINATNYEQAEKLLAEENYSGAIAVLSKLGDYKDSAERLLEIQKAEYEKAEDCFEAGDYDKAISGFSALGDYEDSAEKVQEVQAKIENVLQPIRKALEEDMAEGYNMLKKLPASFDAATELLSQCKPFIPYCGRYRLKGSTTEFVSKFSLKNGMVYWLPDFGEATGIRLTSGSKVLHTYWEKPTAVDTEKMSTSESYIDSDGQKYTFTAEFVSGNQIEMRKPKGDILTLVKLDEVLA